MNITHKGTMNIGRLAYFAVGVICLCACNLFGFYSSVQSPLPTTQMELTLSAKSPDSNADPKYDAVEATSKDGQSIHIDLTLLFKIDPTMVDSLQEKGGETYIMNSVPSILRHTSEEVIGAYTARELYGEGRIDFAQVLQTEMNKDISAEGFIFDQLFIRNISFDPAFVATVESEYVSAQATALHQPQATATP